MTSRIAKAYLATLLTLLILDGLMIAFYLAPAFNAAIGPTLASPPAWLPALLFYLAYPALIVVLVTIPALRRGTGYPAAATRAAALGLAAYGTHELTNWSMLAHYPSQLALTDIAWGTVLTAVSATTGLALARRLRQR